MTAEALRSRIASLPLPGSLVSELSEHLSVSGGGKTYAVRSSGSLEDAAASSCAGMHDTVLNVPGDDPSKLADAVRTVWASQFNDAYWNSYVRRSSETVSVPKMAVVIQEQVIAVAAGVVFTVNPSNANATQSVLESVWGLGEGLVSGEISPHTCVVDWSGSTEGEVYSDVPGPVGPPVTVLQSSSKPQKMKYSCDIAAGGGISKVETSATERAASPFQYHKRLLTSLTTACLRIACVYKEPLDIEWAIDSSGAPDVFTLRVLQARPITAMSLSRSHGHWNVILAYKSCVLDETLVGAGFLRLAHAFPPSSTLKFSPNDVSVQFGRAFVPSKIFSGVWSGGESWLDRTSESRAWWKTAHADVEAFVARFFEVEEPTLLRTQGLPRYPSVPAPPSSPGDEATLLPALPNAALALELSRVCTLYETACQYSWTMGQCASHWETIFEDAYQTFITRLVGKDDEAPVPKLANLLTSVGGTGTDPLSLLMSLAVSHGSDAPLAAAVRQYAEEQRKPGKLLAFLSSLPGTQSHCADILGYLNRFYWAAEKDENFAEAHWGEDPSFPLSLYIRIVMEGDHSRSPAQSSQARYDKDRALLESYADVKGVGDAIDALDRLRTYLRLKEAIHRVYVGIGFFLKRLVLEFGNRLCAEAPALFPSPSDCFNCPALELYRFLAEYGPSPVPSSLLQSLSCTVGKYTILNDMWTSVTTSSSIRPGKLAFSSSVGDGSPPPAPVSTPLPPPPPHVAAAEPLPPGPYTKLECLYGVACSSADGGPIVGRARVLESLAENHKLRHGDILVTTVTSPSWTPLFAIIAGLVLEESGILSHGAVVAREYGINAVCGVPGVCTAVKDGDLLLVDGEVGVIHILAPPE